MSERIEQLNNYKAELEKGLEEIKEEIKSNDECDYETVVDCNLNNEIGILVEQCLECGEKIVIVQDLETGDMVELNRSKLIAILSLMDAE